MSKNRFYLLINLLSAKMILKRTGWSIIKEVFGKRRVSCDFKNKLEINDIGIIVEKSITDRFRQFFQ